MAPVERSEEEWVARFMEEFDAEELEGEWDSRHGEGPAGEPRQSPATRRSLMPKQPRMPNVQQMMQQVQKMQKDMEVAQEELKNEIVEASAGGGMVTVKVSGDLEVREVTIDPAAVDPEDVEILADMVLAAVNEALRMAQELAERKLGGATAGTWTSAASGGLGPPGPVSTSYAPPVQRLVTELSKLPGHRQPHGPAAGLPHPAGLRRGRRSRWRRRSARSRSGSGCARCAST